MLIKSLNYEKFNFLKIVIIIKVIVLLWAMSFFWQNRRLYSEVRYIFFLALVNQPTLVSWHLENLLWCWQHLRQLRRLYRPGYSSAFVCLWKGWSAFAKVVYYQHQQGQLADLRSSPWRLHRFHHRRPVHPWYLLQIMDRFLTRVFQWFCFWCCEWFSEGVSMSKSSWVFLSFSRCISLYSGSRPGCRTFGVRSQPTRMATLRPRLLWRKFFLVRCNMFESTHLFAADFGSSICASSLSFCGLSVFSLEIYAFFQDLVRSIHPKYLRLREGWCLKRHHRSWY